MTEPSRLLPSGQGIAMTRVLDAPPAVVWREWTEPAAFADWFGGGPDYPIPLETVSMDVRVGGAWRMAMVDEANGRRVDWRGEYVVVEEPVRLVFTITDQEGDFFDSVVVDLVDLGDGRTEMRVEQRGGGLTPEGYLRAGSGWSRFFDRMAERLAG